MGILPPIPPGGSAADWTINDITILITNIISLALLLASGIAVIYIIIGAFSYFTAYGNEEKATQGKKTIMWAIIGLVVMMVSRIIIASIWGGVSTTTPDFLIP